MDEILEILKQADSARGGKVARDTKTVDTVVEGFLLPLSARIAELGGPAHEYVGGAATKTKPQYLAELRLQVPQPPALAARLRIALEKRVKGTEDDPAIHNYASGVTIVQRASPANGDFAAHIRWGFWTHAPKVKERIVPPFQHFVGVLGWKPAATLISRPVLGLKSYWLSMVGGLVDVADIADTAALTALQDRIATEMVALSSELTK
jgi:hypothetical protein